MVGFFKNTRTAPHIGAVLTIRPRWFGSFPAVSSLAPLDSVHSTPFRAPSFPGFAFRSDITSHVKSFSLSQSAGREGAWLGAPPSC
jgi:hypothetical protein